MERLKVVVKGVAIEVKIEEELIPHLKRDVALSTILKDVVLSVILGDVKRGLKGLAPGVRDIVLRVQDVVRIFIVR